MTQNEWNNYLTSRLSADTAVGLSDSINTDLLQSKSERLNKALQDKVAKLGIHKTDSTYTPDMLLGMNDADSPITQNLQNTRDINPLPGRYDAVEIRHGDNPYDMQGVANKQADDYSKSEYSMKMQREQVARIFNKPVELVTEQDMLDVGNQQQIQKLSDLARTEGEERWIAPLIQNSVQTNLTGKYTDEFWNPVSAPLNVPITSKAFGEVGKRSGAAFGNYAGEAVTANAAADPLQNAFAGPAQSDDLGEYISQLAKESPNEGGLGNAAAGFGYMLGEGIASTLDLVPEVAQYAYGNLVGDGKTWTDSKGLYDEKESKQFKEWTGYNDEILNTLGQEASLAAKNAVENGDYWGLAEVVGKGIMTPELAGTSLGFVGGMILPGTAGKRVVDVATGVNKAAKAMMAADTTGKLTKAEAMVQAGNEAGVGYKIASTLAGNTGYVAGAEGFAKDAEALYQETYNEEMPTAQRIAIRPIGLLWAKMDAGIAKALVLGKDPVAKAVPELIKALPDQMKATLIGKVAVMSGATAARAAGAFGLEALTEGVQTAMEQVAGKYKEGTTSIGDALEDSKYDIAGGALLGGSGGVQFAAPSIAVDVAKGISPSAIIDYAKSGVEKMTETPEQKVMRENFEYSAPLKAEAETALATGAADEVVSRVESIHGRVSKDLDESAPKEFTYGIVIRNALNKANTDGDAEAVKNIYKTIGELDAREDVDFKASSVISDRTYEATKAFIKMVNESTETANDKMDILKAAKASADEAADTVVKTGTKIDANILAKVAALKASIEQEQAAMKDVMGSDSYEEDIKASQELVKLMTDYMNGKDLDTVNAELSTLGYLQLDPTSGEIKADPSRPGLVSYANELTADLLNPAANANLLDKKVTIGKSVTLTGLQGFANSRLTKLFKGKEGTAYQTNKMINSLLPENEEMIAVIKKLQEVNNGLKGLKAETKAKYTTLLDDALNKAQEANEVLVRRQKALEAAGKPTEKGQYAFQIDNKGNETIQLVNYDENKKAVKVEMAKVNEDGTLEWINGEPVTETTVAKPVEAKATPDEVVYKEDYQAKAKFKEDEVVETAKPVEPTIVEETKEVEPETKAVPEYKPNNEDYHNAAKFAKEPEAVVEPKAKPSTITQIRDTIAKLDAELAAELEGVQDMDMKAHVKAHYKKKLEEIQAERGKLDKMMDIVELAVDKKLDENAAKKVNAVLAFASKLVKDLLNRLAQLRTKLRLNREQHKAIVAEMNNLLDAIAQMEQEYLETNKIKPVEVKTAIGKVTKYEDSVYGPMVEAGDKRVAADKKLKSGKLDMYNAMEVIKAEKIAELDAEIAETGSLGARLLKRNLERYGLGTVINRILERSRDSIFGKMNADMFANPEELIANLPKGFKDVFLAEGNKEDKDLLIEHFATMDKYLKSVKIGDIKMNPKASITGKTQGKSHIDINGLIMKNVVKESNGTVHNFPVDIIELIGTVKDGRLELDEQTETILKFYTAKMAVDTQAMIGNILSMDETEMGKYLGITDPAEQLQVKQDAAKGFINSATVRKDIGSEVYRALGLRFDNNTPEFTEESFESALGVLVQAIALDSGVMNGDKSARGNKSQNLIQVNKKVVESDKVLGAKGYEKLIKAMNKLQYLNESRNRPLPTFKQPEPVANGKRLVMNTRIAIDDETNQKMNKTEQIGYKISNRLEKYLKMDEAKVLKAMGYVEIEGSGLHVSEHSAQLARNDKLIREWDILKVFAKSTNDRMFYMPWGQTVSGRYTMLSDIQYQESKLHREFVVAENSTEEVDVHDKDNRQMLEASIMQGLDMDPDKLSPETATANFNKLFKITDEGITVKPEIKDGKPNATHVAIQKAYESMKAGKLNVSAMAEVFAESEGHHGISSIELLVDWDAAIKGNGVLTTHANLEIDAITSGMILTLLQIGSNEAIKMAEKGGIYSADRMPELVKYVHKWLGKDTTFTPGALIEAGKKHAAEIEGKMAEAKKSGDKTELAKLRKELEQDSVFKDLYSTIGVGMIGEVTAYKEKLEKKEKRNASEEMQLAMLDEIGELNLKNIRSIAKSPVMVYIYGASVGSIKNKLTYSLGVDTVVKAIKKLAKLEAKTDRTAEDNAEMSQKTKFVNMFLPAESARKYVDMFGQPAERNWLNVEISEKVIEEIGKVINATFGTAIETAFEDRLGFVNKNRDAVKAVEMLSFEAYKVRLTDAIVTALDSETRYGKGKHNGESYKLSKSELVEINAQLTEKGYGHTIVWKDGDRVRNQSLQKTATKGGAHSMTVEVGEKSITGQVKESKAVANTGAASTIPIHAIDGDMILEVLNRELKGELKGKYTGGNVYDAVVLGINKALLTDTADSYNTGMIETGFNRSIMADQLEKLEAMISGLDADGLINQYKAAIGLRPEGDSRDDYTKEMNRLKLSLSKSQDRIEDAIELNKERVANSAKAYGSGHLYQMGSGVVDVKAADARAKAMPAVTGLLELINQVIEDDRAVTAKEFKGRIEPGVDYVLDLNDFVKGVNDTKSKANVVQIKVVDKESEDYSTGLTTTKKVLELTDKLWESMNKRDTVQILGDADAVLEQLNKIPHGDDAKYWLNRVIKEVKESGARVIESTKPTDSKPKDKARPEFDKLPAYVEGQQNMSYAGIGSRETPKDVLELMTKAATWLEGKGYKLQTGYKRKQANGKLVEEGADKAFSDGTKNKELFGPDMANAKTRSVAEEIHPNLKGMWSAVYNKWVSKVGKEKATEYADGAIGLQERNTFQVFGAKLDTAVDFVLFYAEETKDPMRPKGGTGQAVEMARRKGIPTINMANKDWRKELTKVISEKPAEVEAKPNKSESTEVLLYLKELKTEDKVYQLLSIYKDKDAPKIGGGMIDNTIMEKYEIDEDKPNAEMVKGSQDSTLKDMLPYVDGRTITAWGKVADKWYKEQNRKPAVRKHVEDILKIIAQIENEPKLIDELNWGNTKQEVGKMTTNEINEMALKCAKQG